jgi:hypothetical protein
MQAEQLLFTALSNQRRLCAHKHNVITTPMTLYCMFSPVPVTPAKKKRKNDQKVSMPKYTPRLAPTANHAHNPKNAGYPKTIEKKTHKRPKNNANFQTNHALPLIHRN